MNLDISAIRARLEAATPGPWKFIADRYNPGSIILSHWESDGAPLIPDDDIPFIANAPTDVKALLDEVTSLEAKVKELEEYKRKYEELCK